MNEHLEPSWYTVLGVHPQVSREEIQAAYRRRIREVHPDVSGSEGTTETAKRVNQAYEVLRDPDRREAYDSRRGGVVVSKGEDGDFPSLAAAAESPLRDHTRVLVRGGFYDEHVVLGRPLEFVGDVSTGEVVIVGSGDCCFEIHCDTTLRNLVVRSQAGTAGAEGFGLVIHDGTVLLEHCDVTSDSLSAVICFNENTRVVLRGCQIHDSGQVGVLAWSACQLTLEQCTIYGNGLAGVEITGGSYLNATASVFRDGKYAGLYFHGAASGKAEGCELHGNQDHQVRIGEGTDPHIKDCLIRDGSVCGVAVFDQTRGLIESCTIRDNAQAGAYVSEQANPRFRDCSLAANGLCGIRVDDSGRGDYERCECFDNQGSGVVIETGGDPRLEGCVLRDNAGAGAYIGQQGGGRFLGCEMRGNAAAGISVNDGSKVTVDSSRIHGNGGVGLFFDQASEGSVDGCEIAHNQSSGAVVDNGSRLTIGTCTLGDNDGSGVFFDQQSRGSVTDCDIQDNRGSGVLSSKGADAEVTRCRVKGHTWGLHAKDGGVLHLDQCEVLENLNGAMAQGGQLFASNCRIYDSKATGLLIKDRGRGQVRSCDLFCNTMAGMSAFDDGELHAADCVARQNGAGGILFFAPSSGSVYGCDVAGNHADGLQIGPQHRVGWGDNRRQALARRPDPREVLSRSDTYVEGLEHEMFHEETYYGDFGQILRAFEGFARSRMYEWTKLDEQPSPDGQDWTAFYRHAYTQGVRLKAIGLGRVLMGMHAFRGGDVFAEAMVPYEFECHVKIGIRDEPPPRVRLTMRVIERIDRHRQVRQYPLGSHFLAPSVLYGNQYFGDGLDDFMVGQLPPGPYRG
jgi:hypothetical protein